MAVQIVGPFMVPTTLSWAWNFGKCKFLIEIGFGKDGRVGRVQSAKTAKNSLWFRLQHKKWTTNLANVANLARTTGYQRLAKC